MDMAPRRVDKNTKSTAPTLEQALEIDQIGTDFRSLRSQYLPFKHSIIGGEIPERESDMFYTDISRIERLHQLVQKPREQIADAEALLNITNTLSSSLKSFHISEDIHLSEFVCCLIDRYGGNEAETVCKSLSWKEMGLDASIILRKALGVHTMIGPMDAKPIQRIQRKALSQRKRLRPPDVCCPEEVVDTHSRSKTDTDENVSAVFDILKRRKCIQFEKLVLNRFSFSQTIENIFALSFLVKDGRAEITINDSRTHFVSPRNAPTAKAIKSKEITCHQFVLRFDYEDWKLMIDAVKKGEEAMPYRTRADRFISHRQ